MVVLHLPALESNAQKEGEKGDDRSILAAGGVTGAEQSRPAQQWVSKGEEKRSVAITATTNVTDISGCPQQQSRGGFPTSVNS